MSDAFSGAAAAVTADAGPAPAAASVPWPTKEDLAAQSAKVDQLGAGMDKLVSVVMQLAEKVTGQAATLAELDAAKPEPDHPALADGDHESRLAAIEHRLLDWEPHLVEIVKIAKAVVEGGGGFTLGAVLRQVVQQIAGR